jgi:hypothetical protein
MPNIHECLRLIAANGKVLAKAGNTWCLNYLALAARFCQYVVIGMAGLLKPLSFN